MIPPPSPLGRRAIAPDDAAGARVNPVALLWAHQLRREHKVLVGQITALEGLVGTVRADVGRNCGEFESVKDEVGYVRGEVGTVRSEVKSVMDEMQKVREELKTIREEIRGLGEDRKKWKEEKMAEMEKERPETREELEEKFMTEVGRLRDEVEEMRRGIGEYFALVYAKCTDRIDST